MAQSAVNGEVVGEAAELSEVVTDVVELGEDAGEVVVLSELVNAELDDVGLLCEARSGQALIKRSIVSVLSICRNALSRGTVFAQGWMVGWWWWW